MIPFFIILFGRNGKSLGTLNWKTDKIHIMRDSSFDLSPEKRRKMEAGEYVVHKNKKQTLSLFYRLIGWMQKKVRP